MKIFNLLVFFIFLSIGLEAQETFLRNSFSVRDFFVKNDSIFLIEKRDVKYFNYAIENRLVQTYFIGGYGLEIFDDPQNNEIITVSNEFTQTVSSLRFYNKSSKLVEEVYYCKEGKSLDALIIPELKYAVMSLNNNNISIVDYSKKPSFKVVDNIKLKSMSRRVIYKDNELFYITDLGEIFRYNFKTKKNILFHAGGKKITDFVIYNQYIVYTTFEGEVVRYNTHDNTMIKTRIENNFVLNTITYQQNKLICGTFKGSIILLDMDEMSIQKTLNYHKRSVIKIINSHDNVFYSSSIDKTIKKWEIN
jgi:WD40 repeat protein